MIAIARPVEAEGETIDEAIAAGLAALGVGRERARVEILRDARRGVLGFGAQKARVRVTPRSEILEPERPAPSVAVPGVAPGGEATDGAEVLRRLLALMRVPARVEASAGEEAGQTLLQVSSESAGLLIGRHGETLDALEYLVNRIVGHQEERAVRYLVDAEGYRERRGRELREAARRLAARARELARPQTMNPPLAARERRIVHLALSGDPTVTTRSLGEGVLKRVVVSPVGAAGRSGKAPRE